MSSKWIRKSERIGNFILNFCVETENGCLEWQRARSASGHGNLWHEGRSWGAHRLSLILSGSAIPDDISRPFVCHTCDNPSCCNPDHLYWGNMSTNMKDAYARGQKPKMAGENNVGSVFTENDVRRIRDMLADGIRKSDIAREFNVSHSAIMHISKFRSWGHLQ